MHAALKLQCRRVTGNKKSTIGGLKQHYPETKSEFSSSQQQAKTEVIIIQLLVAKGVLPSLKAINFHGPLGLGNHVALITPLVLSLGDKTKL